MSINPGLERITSLLSFFPPLSIPVVHIAGTNGKGSVSAIIDSTLSISGLSTGRFNSPHLVSVEDSIRINGRPVSRKRYDAVRANVERVDGEHKTGASLFELLTVTALRIFEGDGLEAEGEEGAATTTTKEGTATSKVDVLIIECGMGGLLDATNVFPTSLVLACVLTSVDLDHQGFLGNTPGDIARGKAGIVKEGGVLVGGKQKHQEVIGVVEEVAMKKGAEVVWAAESFVGANIPDEGGNGQQVASFSLHPFVPPRPQPVLTPLPNHNPNPKSNQDFTSSYNLLRTHLQHHIQTTSPLLSQTSPSTPPTTLLPLINSLSSLTKYTSTFPSNPQPILLTHLPLPGSHQIDNLSLALTTLQVLRNHPVPLAILPQLASLLADDEIFQRGVRGVEWDGRCSWISLPPSTLSNSSSTVLVDGAHNSASSSLLSSYLDSLPLPTPCPTQPRRTFILSLSSSPPKTPLETLAPLLRKGDRVACVEFSTPIEGMPWVRPVAAKDLRDCVRRLIGEEEGVWDGGKEGGLEEALKWATGEGEEEGGLVVVCGSLYLVADLFRLVRR